ncbi:sugar ABC transporter permease [Vallitalea longa]|uniref:Sugar ABC transporter permease n=1 Tax=Vallitalea longa TaxID=2936439 RepID=A0A9W5YB71_9FIRM|nr:ABC transporter permease subunit [Vallitalea longa]GKX29405.1 sugar ABC transporter permease [Vallitalea longa]
MVSKRKHSINVGESFKKDWQLYVMLIPLFIWLVYFAYKPLYGLIIAFKDYSVFKGIADSKWVGLENFKYLLTGPGSVYFWRAFKNTIVISLYNIIFGFPIPIILAIMFNEMKNKFFRKSVQTIVYLPYFFSDVVIAGIIISILSPNIGVINNILVNLGIINDGIYFLVEPKYFRSIFVLSDIWKESGFNSIIYFAALSGISPILYEAARMDGASKFQQIKNITIPGIMPTIIIMFILRVGKLLNIGYERILLLYTPQTYEKADIISTYIYRLGLKENGMMDVATATGLFNSIIAFILVYVTNRITRKLSDTGLW